ncbi:MAG: M28 family peptidase [Planctomycetes bacterium]|nr:M28 family peptidase [Planctomycetota bacterium]
MTMRAGMNHCLRVGVWALVWLLAAVVGLAQGTPEGYYATSLVEEAQYQWVLDDMLYTHYGDDRGWGPEHDLAQANIQMLFEDYGLVTNLHAFLYSGSTYYNVVGELPGTVRPDEVYIIGAHYDSVSNPGADDDASGVAAVLEIARLVSQWESEATIRFIAFDREEQGTVGSSRYASLHADDDIRGMVAMDMIAYRDVPDYQARVYGRSQSSELKQALGEALADYAGVVVTIHGKFDGSDHGPFEREGFAACLLHEFYTVSNPYYHTALDSVDTPDYIDYPYATAMTAGVLGWLVEAAGVTPDYPLGDLNGNYEVNGFDIDPFVLLLDDEAAYRQAYPHIDPYEVGDINGDGYINGFDIDPFILLLGD